MSKTLTIKGIEICAHCPMLDYEDRAFCEHPETKGHDDYVPYAIRDTGFPDWCPLPDEKTT